MDFYTLFALCVVLGILGMIVLACIPAFRVTFLNISIFVLGAFAGAVAFLRLDGLLFPSRNRYDHAIELIPLIGATIGGSVFVWLRMLFAKWYDDN